MCHQTVKNNFTLKYVCVSEIKRFTGEKLLNHIFSFFASGILIVKSSEVISKAKHGNYLSNTYLHLFLKI